MSASNSLIRSCLVGMSKIPPQLGELFGNLIYPFYFFAKHAFSLRQQNLLSPLMGSRAITRKSTCLDR